MAHIVRTPAELAEGMRVFEIGLGCAMCHGAAYETIEEGCKAHGMKDKDIEKVVKKLNEKIK